MSKLCKQQVFVRGLSWLLKSKSNLFTLLLSLVYEVYGNMASQSLLYLARRVQDVFLATLQPSLFLIILNLFPSWTNVFFVLSPVTTPLAASLFLQ